MQNTGYKGVALFRVLVLGVLAAATAAKADPPVTGLPIPALADIDQAVIQVMEAQDIAGCTVGVMRNGRIIYQRGFGWRNEGQSVAMPENATMRLASVSKAIVRQVINELITDGSLDGDRPVFDVGQEGGGILNIAPWPNLQDERMGQITSRHLRDLKVDWESDHAWESVEIYEAMGFDPETDPPPLSIEDMTRYALGRELGVDPGLAEEDWPEDFDGYPYSNFAYNVLVLVIEEITGKSFFSYLRQDLLTRHMWVPSSDLYQAHPFAPIGLREPHYFSTGNSQNVYDPEWPSVPTPYGGFNVEAMVGSSFIVTSAAPLLTFMDNYSSRWTGNMAGSSAIVKDSAFDPEVDIVVLCNDTSNNGTASVLLAEAIDDVIDDVAPWTWPSNPIDGQWVDWLALQPLTGIGSYDVPYNSVEWAVSNSSSGTKLQFHPGDNPFTGTINKRLRLKAPIGTVRLGVGP